MFRMHRLIHLLVPSLLLALLSACGATPAAAPAATAVAVATTAPIGIPTDAATATIAEATVVPEATATTAVEKTASAAETTAPAGAATLNVFAAASLIEAFGEIGTTFEAQSPGVTVAYNFASSNQLAQQITEGAPADVFASANKRQMDVVVAAGQVITGTQHTFVRNRLVVVYPSENPAGLQTLQDLTKPGLKLVLAAKEVPVGQYALDFLGKASLLPDYTEAYSPTVLANVVSYEENVRAVLAKVSLGEADAGIVYTSDVAGEAASTTGRIDIPDELNTIASYPIAPIKDAPNAAVAERFVAYILSPEAQTVLVKYGFIPTTGSATGEAPAGGPIKIRSLVANPVTLSVDDLRGMPPMARSSRSSTMAACATLSHRRHRNSGSKG